MTDAQAMDIRTRAGYILKNGSDDEHYISDGDLDILESFFDHNGDHDAALIMNAAFRMKGVYDFVVEGAHDQYVAAAALIEVAFKYSELPREARA